MTKDLENNYEHHRCCECHNFDGKMGCFARPRIIVSVNDEACYKFQMEVDYDDEV